LLKNTRQVYSHTPYSNYLDVCFAPNLWNELLALDHEVSSKFEREFLCAIAYYLFVNETEYEEWVARIELFSRGVLTARNIVDAVVDQQPLMNPSVGSMGSYGVVPVS
jgi:hypothetical protein